MYNTVNDVNMACMRQSNMACIRQPSDVKPANVFLTPSKDSAVSAPCPEYGMYKTVSDVIMPCIRQSDMACIKQSTA